MFYVVEGEVELVLDQRVTAAPGAFMSPEHATWLLQSRANAIKVVNPVLSCRFTGAVLRGWLKRRMGDRPRELLELMQKLTSIQFQLCSCTTRMYA